MPAQRRGFIGALRKPNHLILPFVFKPINSPGITIGLPYLHGELDRVVPIAFGERLYAAIRAPKQFVRFATDEHERLDAHGAIAAVREFLAAAPADLN